MTQTVGRASRLPERPTLDGLEEAWARRWQEEETYAFDRSADRADVYSIDTPPPTVSGALHIGHVFSYTQTDIIARFQRMRGKAVFYPIGWDDNGLATERRVQYHFGVRCDPSLPYDPSFVPQPGSAELTPISRPNFVALCRQLTEEDERAYEALWRRLGLSFDWSYQYTTIGDRARLASQRAFLRALARGEAYTAQAPTLWDTTYATAVAQAELEDRERPGAYHRIVFRGPAGEPIEIDTTRPELLPACVALVCHPDDDRYAGLVGSDATTPVFGVEVPIRAHHLADPAKGTGIAMVCTFGDLTDVTWWRELDLATRVIIGRDGRLLPDAPSDVDPARYQRLAGRTVNAARREIVAMLGDALVGEPRPITHPVKFYERGERPLEIVATRQWYIRNGGRDPDLRKDLLEYGRALAWTPEYMRHRYEHWVNGLVGDWLISRQRFFGVPFPVWYPLGADGEPDYEHPLIPDESRLPVDPTTDVPDGFTEADRGRPGGFVADPDVMDTWATSSLTPQIAGGWCVDEDLFARVYPMDHRAQAHEIIRTWLFATIVRARAEFGALPWRSAVISGWILDPDRKKLSKSKGNAETGPAHYLDRFGSDGVRYWAASGRPGVDTALDEGQMKVGRRLATKILNATKFVLGLAASGSAQVSEPLDVAMLGELDGVVRVATEAMAAQDYTTALAATETFFWRFCDDYIELVKDRAYGSGPGAASAQAALLRGLDVLLRLLAPVLPYATEEAWSWWHDGSVHRAAWPVAANEPGDAAGRGDAGGGDAGGGVAGGGEAGCGAAGDARGGVAADALFALAAEALGQIRREKSRRKLSMRAEFDRVSIAGGADDLALLRAAAGDLRAAGRVGTLDWHPTAGALTITVG
ncbi:valine--tRNA ligase [Luedemannella helvata]|uniref:Valine--tRNA ligase n=1 Tax=Luedemannella helvata TaxID=349315 RepID=A0ABN2JP50_9ACTN